MTGLPLAIVTGGSSGIGKQLVSAFCDAGYAVAFRGRSSPEVAARFGNRRTLWADGAVFSSAGWLYP